jgi:hypothetical protein
MEEDERTPSESQGGTAWPPGLDKFGLRQLGPVLDHPFDVSLPCEDLSQVWKANLLKTCQSVQLVQ